jgi:hypothetical protein
MRYRDPAMLIAVIMIVSLMPLRAAGQAAQAPKEAATQPGAARAERDKVPSLRMAAKQLIHALDPRGRVELDLVLTGTESDRFECTATNSRVRSSCLLACAFAQTIGCACSSVPDGCACECAPPPGDSLISR